MKTLLLFTFVLLAGCGSKAKLEIVQTAPGEYLIVDRNCTAVVRKRVMRGGDYILRESEGYCHDTNITLGEHISETYGMEGVFQDGERVYIWSEKSMEKLLQYLIRNGMAHRGED